MKRPVSRAVPRVLLLAAMPAILAACAADNEPSSMPTGYKYTNVQQYRVPVTGPERSMQYPGMDAGGEQSRMQPSAGEMVTPMGAPPMQSVTSTSTMTSTTQQTSQGAAMPLANAAAPTPPAPPPVMAPPPMTPPPVAAPPVAAPPLPPQAAAMPSPDAASPPWHNAAQDLLGKAEVRFGRLRDPVYVRDAVPGQPGEIQFRAALLETMAREHYKIAPAADKAPFTFDYSLNGQPNAEETITLKTVAEGREASRVTGMYNMAMPGSTAMAPAVAPMMTPAASMPAGGAPMPPAAQTAPMQPVPWGSSSTAPGPAAPAGPTASAAPMYQSQPMQAEPSVAPPVPSHAPAMTGSDAGTPGAAQSTETSTTTTTSSDQTSDQTYVYDGRSMNAPGKTAYEQLHGTDHQVDAGSDEDISADH